MKRFLTALLILLTVICLLSAVSALILQQFVKTPQDTESDTESQSNTEETVSGTMTQEETTNTSTITIPSEQLRSGQVFVYDVSASEFLYEKGTELPIAPASITKLLTALYALSVMPLDELIQPRDELDLIAADSSIAYIKTHHTLTLEMLIEGMLLPSGNDAAYVVAAGTARYVTGDPDMSGKAAVEYFMEQANKYAERLGCTGTHFKVPDGLVYEGHYTTAQDLVILAKKAMETPIIMKYTGIVTDKVFYASGHTMTWKNSNPLINPESSYYSPYVTGLKTGSLTDAYSVLVSAEIEERAYIIGLFDSPTWEGRYVDAKKILAELEKRS